MITSEFLFPTALRVNPTALSKVLIVGSCLTQNMVVELVRAYPHLKLEFVLFNNVGDLPSRPPSAVTDYQFQYLQIPLYSLLRDRTIDIGLLSANALYEVEKDASAQLELMLESGLKYSRESGLLAMVANFIVPQTSIAASLKEAGTAADLSELVRRLNTRLATLVAERPNVYLADLESIAGSLGKAAVLDEWHHVYAHNSTFLDWTEWQGPPFHLQHQDLKVAEIHPTRANEFYQLAWAQAEAIYRTVLGVDRVKLVIFDLDNTLWRGQIAENYRDNEDWPHSGGWPEGLVETIHHLRARGILVALCSKNDQSVVERNWDRAHPARRLTMDAFITARINWRPKAENIAEILEELNLTDKSVVFVDDSPVERESVKGAFPRIRTIGDNQYLTRIILLRSPETQAATLTHESKRRESMMRSQLMREQERASLSREGFLQSLECRMTPHFIRSAVDAQLARAGELLNKTNQFNTTGARWTPAELSRFLADGGRFLTVSVTDRFSDYGLVGVAALSGPVILQFVMSCRVLGLGIEKAALSLAVNDIRAREAKAPILARMRATEDNFVCRDIYSDNGFVAQDATNAEWRFKGGVLKAPAHIEIIEPRNSIVEWSAEADSPPEGPRWLRGLTRRR